MIDKKCLCTKTAVECSCLSLAGPGPSRCGASLGHESSIGLTLTCVLCRFEATKMRAGVCKFTAYEDVPHLDRAFILQNLRHMEALRIVGPAP